MMNLYCNVCDCKVPLSYDLEKSKLNLITHFEGSRHNSCLKEWQKYTLEWRVDCDICDGFMSVYGFKQHVLYDHVCGRTHFENLNKFLDSQQSSEYEESESEPYNTSSYEDSTQNSNMLSIFCNACDCEVPLSYDQEKSKLNLNTHFKGIRHNKCLKEWLLNRSSWTADCNLCEITITMYWFQQNELYDHVCGRTHLENINLYLDCQQSSEYEESEEDSDCVRSPFFYCRLCECKVLLNTRSNEMSIDQMSTHIFGRQHQNNLQQSDNQNSMYCNLCECDIPMAFSERSCLRNLSVHINGHRHEN